MPCDHKGGPELIEMAEAFLQAKAVPAHEWSGLRFRWAENLADSMWASVVVEIERRDASWIITRLDRNKHSLQEDETGFRQV